MIVELWKVILSTQYLVLNEVNYRICIFGDAYQTAYQLVLNVLNQNFAPMN